MRIDDFADYAEPGRLFEDQEYFARTQPLRRPIVKIQWDCWAVWCVLVPMCIIAVFSVGTMAYYEFFRAIR
jgi:hypothetical protein